MTVTDHDAHATAEPGTSSRFESLRGAVDLDFPEYDRPPDEPMGLLRRWLADADERGVREPKALALATADARGRASTRIVVIVDVTDGGVVFTSHRCSQKGRDLDVNPWASGLLYWRETGQQIVLSGPVVRLPEAESDVLWRRRPVPLHAMSTVTRQSRPVTDVPALRAAALELEAQHRPLPRPEFFAGYRLEPAAAEFWSAASDRLHRRLRFDLTGDGGWRTSRLQP